MKQLIKRIPFTKTTYRGLKSIVAYFTFLTDFYRFKRQSKSSDHRFSIHWKDRLVCLRDKTRTTGFDRHYVFHTAWAARILSEIKPEYHVDISSDLRFVTLVSAFIPIKFYDFRPANLELPDLTSKHANLTNLPFEDISIKSLSSMHVVEHIGFGRYGDPIDPQGDIKAISELKRVLSQGGSLLFVVPIGRPRIQFNAHRIYSYDQIIGYFQGLKLEQFALIPDKPAKGGLIANATKEMADEQSYGCGCFHFKKLDKNAKKNC